MKRFVFLILILFYVIDMSAQTCRKEIRVGFRIGNDVVEPDYCDNASSLSEIIDFLNELQNNPSLIVVLMSRNISDNVLNCQTVL